VQLISRKDGMVRTRILFKALLALCFVVGIASARASDVLRIGLQSTGTFAWQLDVIRRHGLAASAGLDLKISQFASPDAAKLALNSGSVDIAVVDWLWVARARALGAKLMFYPYSSAVGAIMVKNDSTVHGIEDLRGQVLAVAGGPLDKSWLIVRAAAARRGIDLKREATLEYGAPPLMAEKLRQGEAVARRRKAIAASSMSGTPKRRLGCVSPSP
jgi:NitT/TauT family transport system substrate-binding protein